MSTRRFIVAIEDPRLRAAMMAGMLNAGIRAEQLTTTQLLTGAGDQATFVLLNTGGDLERLVSTATRVYENWTRCGGEVYIRTYSLEPLTTDAVISRLWGIADELVSVGVYRPATVRFAVEEVLCLAKRF